MSASVIDTSTPRPPRISTFMVVLLCISLFVLLVLPSEEQKTQELKQKGEKKFRAEFMQAMMSALTLSKECDSIKDEDEKKRCLKQVMDFMKNSMGALRKDNDKMLKTDDNRLFGAEFDDAISRVEAMSEKLAENSTAEESATEDKFGWVEDNEQSTHTEEL